MSPLSVDQLVQRRLLWSAMSDFFLDTEVRWSVPFVGKVCAESGLDDDTLSSIFWCEVFPLAISNLHDIAGEWAMLQLPEDELLARAHAPTRDRVLELGSVWMVKAEWEAALVVCRRLRTEPRDRFQRLTRTWDTLGKRYLEDLGRKLLTDPLPMLTEASAGGVDLQAEWTFYEPLLRSMNLRSEGREAQHRADEVTAMLAAVNSRSLPDDR
ncbi:MAG: hypothetical protein Q8S33_01525 [Myxococcales bacterium]|nr:hypothetical protein [Myxococcales bacterium]